MDTAMLSIRPWEITLSEPLPEVFQFFFIGQIKMYFSGRSVGWTQKTSLAALMSSYTKQFSFKKHPVRPREEIRKISLGPSRCNWSCKLSIAPIFAALITFYRPDYQPLGLRL